MVPEAWLTDVPLERVESAMGTRLVSLVPSPCVPLERVGGLGIRLD